MDSFELTIGRTFDPELVRGVMTIPEIFSACSEDGQYPDDYHPNVDADCWLEVSANDLTVGLYKLHPHNCCTLWIHAQILPEFRDTYAKASSIAVLRWILEESPRQYQKVIAEIPVIYPNVIYFTKNAGFQEEGVNRASHRRNGKLHDCVILGITREEIASFLRGKC